MIERFIKIKNFCKFSLSPIYIKSLILKYTNKSDKNCYAKTSFNSCKNGKNLSKWAVYDFKTFDLKKESKVKSPEITIF